ncbi:TetR/AcrR family transcriptional regulator [Nocardia sp. NPDC020380]|uniref:TetR/AcrR family transcriptional regulator n=1 Tax=Nocardia sp. NPDC020380 TaxID=3364309 RepID=UPI00379F9F3F
MTRHLESGRKKRDRARTEADLLDAAERLFDRDGVLAGLNLNEVAAEAGVNRGQIYQMYGSRRSLLRAALARGAERFRRERPGHWEGDFASRRKVIFRLALTEQTYLRFAALLALDHDEEFQVFPEFEQTRAALERDKATGALPADADGEALHALTAAAYAGYSVLRETMSRDTGIPLAELDRRVIAAYDKVVDGMVHGN